MNRIRYAVLYVKIFMMGISFGRNNTFSYILSLTAINFTLGVMLVFTNFWAVLIHTAVTLCYIPVLPKLLNHNSAPSRIMILSMALIPYLTIGVLWEPMWLICVPFTFLSAMRAIHTMGRLTPEQRHNYLIEPITGGTIDYSPQRSEYSSIEQVAAYQENL